MDKNIGKAGIGFIYGSKNSRLPFYLSEFLKEYPQNGAVEYVCFSLSDINFNLMTVSGTVVDKNGITEKETAVPGFIFNFVCHTKSDNIKAMRQLRTTEGYKIFNPINRFNNAVIFNILRSFPLSEQFLLPFRALNRENIMQQLQSGEALYILPERGISPKNTICAKKAEDGLVELSVGANKLFCTADELPEILLKMTVGKKYMSMEGVTLLMRNGAPLEAGVYLQKNQKGRWQPCFSVAKNDIFSCGSVHKDNFENLSSALFEEAPEMADEISAGIYNLSVTLCSFLDYYIIDMASVMLDYIISDRGCPYLIMLGGCEQQPDALKGDTERAYYFNIFKYMLYAAGANLYASDGK